VSWDVAKVLWVPGLIVLPVLTAIIYIVARGKGMAQRQQASVQKAKADTDAYIRHRGPRRVVSGAAGGAPEVIAR
jgi:hypothetical protein